MNNKEYTDAVEQGKYPNDPLVPLPASFEDQRGVIQNLVNASINGVAIITSKKGTIRSDHWHREDFHYLYVVSGKMRYLEQSGEAFYEVYPDEWEKDFIVGPGDMVFIPAEDKHRLRATESPLFYFEFQAPNRFKTHILDGTPDDLRWNRVDGRVWVQT